MNPTSFGPIKLAIAAEQWPLKSPFRISGYTFEATPTIKVSLSAGGQVGCGEATGVYYRGDDVEGMFRQIESVRGVIEAGIDRMALQRLLPSSGARNAVDCALWDLEAKLVGRPAWQLAGVDTPRPLLTTFTCGADEPDVMVERAVHYRGARAIKLKLTGDPLDVERVRCVRSALPNVWLGVDANQGFARPFLENLLPTLVEARVELIEQPFAVGQEDQLDGFQSPIPIAADESLQALADLHGLVGRFEVVNIKLDKCGGLTEGLAIARAARELGLKVMVGNMTGTSLAMAPAFIVGQLCDVVDLDGPVFLKEDREIAVRYHDGRISVPDELWGGAA